MKVKLFPTRQAEYLQKLRDCGCSGEAATKTVADMVKGIEAQGVGPMVIQCEGAIIMVNMDHVYFDLKAPQGIIKAIGVKQ